MVRNYVPKTANTASCLDVGTWGNCHLTGILPTTKSGVKLTWEIWKPEVK